MLGPSMRYLAKGWKLSSRSPKEGFGRLGILTSRAISLGGVGGGRPPIGGEIILDPSGGRTSGRPACILVWDCELTRLRPLRPLCPPRLPLSPTSSRTGRVVPALPLERSADGLRAVVILRSGISSSGTVSSSVLAACRSAFSTTRSDDACQEPPPDLRTTLPARWRSIDREACLSASSRGIVMPDMNLVKRSA